MVTIAHPNVVSGWAMTTAARSPAVNAPSRWVLAFRPWAHAWRPCPASVTRARTDSEPIAPAIEKSTNLRWPQ